MEEKRSKVWIDEGEGVAKLNVKNNYNRIMGIYSFPLEFAHLVDSRKWYYVSGHACTYNNGVSIQLGHFVATKGSLEKIDGMRVHYLNGKLDCVNVELRPIKKKKIKRAYIPKKWSNF